jgi:hypothetical protein
VRFTAELIINLADQLKISIPPLKVFEPVPITGLTEVDMQHKTNVNGNQAGQ